MKLIDTLPSLKQLKEFKYDDRDDAIRHLTVDGLNKEGNPRYICALLAVLYDEVEREDLKEIVLECCWIARRMNSAMRKPQDEL